VVHDVDQTETERTMRAKVPEDERPAILWVFPEYGQITAPDRRWVVGRAGSCNTVLPGSRVSREHAEISPVGAAFGIRDLESRNGVSVNGQRVAATALVNGDVVRLGEWVGVVVPGISDSAEFGEIAPGLLGGPRLAAELMTARKLAEKGIPLVIQGATGTGKERVARALHAWSKRKGEYVGVNCAAIPGDLAEAELFGHAKGAYTGADRPRLGYFRQADQGTLLLDEFLELAPRTQAKLLRVLEENEVQPLGDNRAYPVNVLVLAATQRPLADLVDAGHMRNDLVARLGVYSIRLPPLAERKEDVPALFTYFARDQAGGKTPVIDPELVEWLCMQPWPQNVRELEWLARAMVALHDDAACLTFEHLPPQYRNPSNTAPPLSATSDPDTGDTRELFDKLMKALDENGGVIVRAAEALGITRQKAYRILGKQPGFALDSLRRRR
jgi:transcriptional regulator of acetoin/glycerol metabolism